MKCRSARNRFLRNVGTYLRKRQGVTPRCMFVSPLTSLQEHWGEKALVPHVKILLPLAKSTFTKLWQLVSACPLFWHSSTLSGGASHGAFSSCVRPLSDSRYNASLRTGWKPVLTWQQWKLQRVKDKNVFSWLEIRNQEYDYSTKDKVHPRRGHESPE